jgi:hypothetical protein
VSPEQAPARVNASANPEFERRLALFIGPRWPRYQRKFRPFLADASFVPTWNWAAALGTEYWFLYRKMYLWFAVFFFVPTWVLQWLWGQPLTPEAVLAPENDRLRLLMLALQVSQRLAAGGVANWLLFRRARAAVVVLDAQRMPAADGEALLRRLGGTNGILTGFVIGLLALLALLQVAGLASG